MPAAEGQDVQVWQKVFQELIHEVRPWHQWTLTLDNSLVPNALQPGWTQYQQQVFARFTCSWCSRNWASAHVQVLCHMHWNKRESTGRVKMKIFAQRCQKCSEPPFEVPEFTEENVSRILNNLVFRILKKCYGEGFKSMENIPTIKDISLKGPHDTDNCEACLQGFCVQCELDLVKPSPMSPSLPTRRGSTHTSGVTIDKPSLTRSSTAEDAATGHSGVKTGGGVHNPGFSELPRALGPRASTNYWEERIVWNSTIVTADTRVKTGGGVHNPGFPELPRAQNPRPNTNYRAESTVRSSTAVGVGTADTGVKKSRVVHHPWYPEAKSPREVSTVRSSTTVGVATGHTGVKKGGGVHHPRFPPPRAKSPRAHTSCRAESIVEVYSPRAGLDRHSTQNGRHCNFGICCCSIILILIIVVVVVVKTTI